MSSISNSNTQDRQGDVSLTINSTLDPINPDHEKKIQFEVEALSYEYPEGGLSAWIVVAGPSMMMACTFGMMSTVGVLQSY
ncbi:hypothetical protein N7449_012405 [Penicillium cf. viridicatum]|uniref:Uncharacterized protein n=1 Tax=Penicillium cf. viridicatum TaxID=2972119 RepID=A0A9W9LY60_9EURO|nr:hypothetical protein N7449_012405 [Penicillium cf. viridicatum]